MINLKNNSKKLIIKVLSTIMFSLLLMIITSGISYAEVFEWPLKDAEEHVTSAMYDRSGIVSSSSGFHKGWDIAGTKDQSIKSIASGTVIVSDEGKSGEGYHIVIKHELETNLEIGGTNYGNVLYSEYMHMKELSPCKVGDTVSKGTVIGQVGSSGNSTGNHLHFEIRNTKDKSVSKDTSKSTGIGVSKFSPQNNRTVYTIIYSNSDDKIANFSPELIIGQNLSAEIINPTVSTGNAQENSLGVYSGNRGTYGSGITDRTDVLIDLTVDGVLNEYGKLPGLENTTEIVKKELIVYSKIISAVLMFVFVLICGAGIITNRNNPEKRMMFLSGVGAIGVGGLIISSATLIITLIMEYM